MDITAELLPLAMAKGCYEKAVVRNLNEPLALDAGSFDAIISVGFFSCVEKFDTCFDETVRLARPGALFIFMANLSHVLIQFPNVWWDISIPAWVKSSGCLMLAA